MSDNRRPRNVFRTEVRHPAVPRMTYVASIKRQNAGAVRVVLEGPELGEFSRNGVAFPAMSGGAFDDVVILCFADPHTGIVELPGLDSNGNLLRPASSDWLAREYTVRKYARGTPSLTVDFILHNGGTADAWVRAATVGDPLGIIGPRMVRALPSEPHLLAIGDATAIPAMARLVEELKAPTQLEVYILADRDDLGCIFPANPLARINWIDPMQGVQGALEQLTAGLGRHPLPSRTWAWVAGESALVGDIRRRLIQENGLDKARIQFTGYWKLGSPAAV